MEVIISLKIFTQIYNLSSKTLSSRISLSVFDLIINHYNADWKLFISIDSEKLQIHV
jgi:hypothetical protein